MRRQKTIRLAWIVFLLCCFMGMTGLGRPDARAAESDAGIQVRAFPLKAVTGRQDQQTLIVIVQDQNFMPVQGAEVSLSVRLPDHSEQHLIVNQPTGTNGMTQTNFPISCDEVGVVILDVQAIRSGMEAGTSTSFRLWY